MKHVHLIVVGDECPEKHLKGLDRFEPYKVILFDSNSSDQNLKNITERLEDKKIPFRVKKTEDKKGSVYLAVVSVAANYLKQEDVFFVINKSAGEEEKVLAVEAAIQSPLGTGQMMGHGHSDGVERKAFCYKIKKNDSKDGSEEENFTIEPVPLTKIPPQMGLEMGEKAMPTKSYRWNKLRSKLKSYRNSFPVRIRILKNKFKERLGLR